MMFRQKRRERAAVQDESALSAREKMLGLADQGCDRLGQLLALLSKNLYSYDNQDHADSICKWPARNQKNQAVKIMI